MSARADRPARRARPEADSRRCLSALIGGIVAATPVAASAAQVGAVASIFSDDRVRGISVSDGQPVAMLDLSYDDSSGLYGNLSGGVVVDRGDGIKALSVVLNGGYAKRLGSGLTADFGASHSRYSHYSGLSSGREFNEAYAGLTGKLVGARISTSPDYIGLARWTAHGELDAHMDLSQKSTLEGAVGLLVPLGNKAYRQDLAPQVDAQFGILRRAGPVTLHALVSARTGSDAAYGGGGRGRFGLVVGLSTAL